MSPTSDSSDFIIGLVGTLIKKHLLELCDLCEAGLD